MPSRRTFLGTIGATIGTTSIATVAAGQTDDAASPDGATSAADPADWPRFGFDAGNTGYNPAGTAPQSTPETLWTAPYGLYGNQTEGPYIADGIVYDDRTGTNDQSPGVRALDAASGDEAWSVELAETPWSMVVADGLLHVGTDHRLLKFDAGTGERLGERRTIDQTFGPSPVVVDGTLYAGFDAGRGAVAAIDVESYERLWVTDSLDAYTSGTAPAVVDGSVYVLDGGGVAELDAADGSQQRVFEADTERTPVVSDGTLYVPAEGSLDAFDLDSGDRIWRYESAERHRFDPTVPVVDDGRVYVTDATGTTPPLIALDAENGSVEWRFKDDTICGSRDWDPGFARVGDLLVAANDMNVFYGLDPASGEVQWRYSPTDPWTRHHLDDFVVGDGVLYAQFDGENGVHDEIWAIGEPDASE